MDFSSQLANLQRTASAAASKSGDNRSGGPDGRRPYSSPDRRRHAPYDRNHHQRRRHHGRGGRGRHGPWDNNEGNLKQAIASLPRYRPRHNAGPRDRNDMPHLALLMITIDDLPYEEIWREWASPENQEKAGMQVSMLCHAKNPNAVKSSWLRQRLLVNPPVVGRGHEYEAPVYHTRCPEWGSIEITRAMLDLLQEGLQVGYCREADPRFSDSRYSLKKASSEQSSKPVDKFIFCSETCLPVTTLKEVKTALFGSQDEPKGDDETKVQPKVESKNDDDTKPEAEVSSKSNDDKKPQVVETKTPAMSLWDVSWVNARSTPNNGYSRQLQFDKVNRAVPGTCIWKADQWIVLSRQHAVAIMDIDRHLPRDAALWRCFLQCKASDEMYFPTALALLGFFEDNDLLSVKDEINIRRVTFADWSESAKNPVSYTKGVQDLKAVANSARKEGCLFARKFSPFEQVIAGSPQGNTATGTGMITAEQWKSAIQELTEKCDRTDT